MLDRAAIEAIIPHRAPFLLVDRIIALEEGSLPLANWMCARMPSGCPATSRSMR